MFKYNNPVISNAQIFRVESFILWFKKLHNFIPIVMNFKIPHLETRVRANS